MIYSLDASAIIAHLDAADAHHDRIRATLDRAVAGRLLAHPVTVAECLVAAVRAGRGPQMVGAIAGMGVETAELDAGSPLRLAHLRVATGLRMPDCCALAVARDHAGTLVTFDERQARAARTQDVPVEP